MVGGGWVYLNYSVNSGPFFEIVYEIWVSFWYLWPFSLWDQGPEFDNKIFQNEKIGWVLGGGGCHSSDGIEAT